MRKILLFCLLSIAAVAQTVAPIPIPKPQFFDNDGLICSGCQLFSYGSGSTTLQATYADYTGLVPNPNPIILNAAGYPASQIWLGNSGYKFVMEDASGNVLWTSDNVTAVAQLGHSTITFDGTHTITGLPSPVSSSDVATKAYVDASSGTGIITGSNTFTGVNLAKNWNAIRYSPAWSTTLDAGAQISAAIADWKTNGGPCEIWVSYPTISTWPDIPATCHLTFLTQTYTVTTPILLAHKDTEFDGRGSIFKYTKDDSSTMIHVGKAANFSTMTATFTNGSSTVTLVTGSFADYDVGDAIFANGQSLVVTANNGTTLTTLTNYGGTTGTYQFYGYMDQLANLGQNIHPLRIKDATFLNNASTKTTPVNGLTAYFITKPIFQNLRFELFSNTSSVAMLLYGVIDAESRGLSFNYNGSGLWLNGGTVGGMAWGSNANSFYDTAWIGNTNHPLLIDTNSAKDTFLNNHFEGNTATVSAIVQNNVANITLRHNYFERNGDGTGSSADVEVVGAGADTIILDDSFLTSSNASYPTAGFIISSATNVTVSHIKMGNTAYAVCYNYISGATGTDTQNDCAGVTYGASPLGDDQTGNHHATSYTSGGTNGGVTLPYGTGSSLALTSTNCGLYANSSTGYPHVNCGNGTHSFDITGSGGSGGGATVGNVQLASATGGFSPAQNTTYYVGNIGAGFKTASGSQVAWAAPAACSIKSVTYYLAVGGTLDSAANFWTVSLYKNGSTVLSDTTDSTHIAANAGVDYTTVSPAPSDSLAAGDTIMIKVVTPTTFSTPPTTVVLGASFLCQ